MPLQRLSWQVQYKGVKEEKLEKLMTCFGDCLNFYFDGIYEQLYFFMHSKI